MTRAALVALALASSTSCAHHPALSVGFAGATIGFGACEIDGVASSTCAVVGATAALALGGITWLVTTLFDTEDHGVTFADDDELTPTGGVKVHTHTAPPPVVIDAGVSDALLVVDAGAPADAPAD